MFQSLVYPAALREILNRIVRIEEHTDTEDPDDWRSRWLRFAADLPGVGEAPAQEDLDRWDDWIEIAVAAFARRFQTMQQFTAFWQRGDH